MKSDPKILVLTIRRGLLMIVSGIDLYFHLKSYRVKFERLDPGDLVLVNGKEVLVTEFEDDVLTVEPVE